MQPAWLARALSKPSMGWLKCLKTSESLPMADDKGQFHVVSGVYHRLTRF